MKSSMLSLSFILFLFTLENGLGDGTNSVAVNKGYFKCRFGKLNVIDSAAGFAVNREESTEYSLYVTFCYEPMTKDDVKVIKEVGSVAGLSLERRKEIKVARFPGRTCPSLHILVGDWPIGQPPPAKGNSIVNLSLVSGGETVRTSFGSTNVEGIVEWSIEPDGDEFIVSGWVKGRSELANKEALEWNLPFRARTVNWRTAKNGLSRNN